MNRQPYSILYDLKPSSNKLYYCQLSAVCKHLRKEVSTILEAVHTTSETIGIFLLGSKYFVRNAKKKSVNSLKILKMSNTIKRCLQNNRPSTHNFDSLLLPLKCHKRE